VNPLRQVPLKRFYRYNLQSSLSFDNDGFVVPLSSLAIPLMPLRRQELSSYTVFRDLPIDPIYTLAMDVPPSWLVRPRQALYDLDNIQLGNLSPEDPSVEAIFDLDYLVIEGHAREATTQAPPRGVQLQLTNSNSTSIDDTLIAANLGYLQFKAKPGVFRLEIRPGRGREIFEMESVGNEGWESPSVDTVGNEITLTSFEGLTLYPRLRRRPGMENANVLVELSEQTVSPPESPMESIMSR
jgi:UDP-glucose:glycoprotein glucosyltransferase